MPLEPEDLFSEGLTELGSEAAWLNTPLPPPDSDSDRWNFSEDYFPGFTILAWSRATYDVSPGAISYWYMVCQEYGWNGYYVYQVFQGSVADVASGPPNRGTFKDALAALESACVLP